MQQPHDPTTWDKSYESDGDAESSEEQLEEREALADDFVWPFAKGGGQFNPPAEGIDKCDLPLICSWIGM